MVAIAKPLMILRFLPNGRDAGKFLRLQIASLRSSWHIPLCVILLSLDPQYLFAQNHVTGIITGTNRQPIAGATVSVKGTNLATLSLNDGSFSIKASRGNTLLISFTGFHTREIRIGFENELAVALEESSSTLEEVLVTGYTSQKVKEITGSVAIVKPKDLTSIPAGQVEQMLQGRVAGLNIITSGMPGGASNVRLHGIGNFGDVTPLYIIDGVQGNINSLNPNDIESIQVLKDAGAYSIFGVRGANGVIVITTKKGKQGSTRVHFDSYIGITKPLKRPPELLSVSEFADLRWIALKNSGYVDANGNPRDPIYGNGPAPEIPDYLIPQLQVGVSRNDPRGDPLIYNSDFNLGPVYQIIESNKKGTDWFHELFTPAVSQNHTISISGANEKNRYNFSFGYLDQQGTFLHSYLKRYTSRINTEFAVHEKIRIGENVQLSYRDNPLIATQRGPNGNEIYKSLIAQPILPVYDIKGGWAHLSSQSFEENPVALRTLAKDDKTNDWEVFGNAYAEVDLVKSITLRSSFGGYLINYFSNSYRSLTYEPTSARLPDNSFRESSGYKRSWTWTNTLKFYKSFLQDHTLTTLVGTEAISNYNREIGGTKNGFFTNDPNYRFLTNGSPVGQSNYSFASTSTLSSILGRLEYNFKSRYFLTATIRRDGSSIFSPRTRFGWFPAISGAWRLVEETWMRRNNWLQDLKLRASWGKTGFYGNTDPFNQYTLYGGSIGDAYYNINGTGIPNQGFRMTRIGDPRTGWQEDIVSNAGIDLILLDGAYSVTADFYKKKTKGLLFPLTLPDILGGATPPNTNVGMIENTGFDLLLNTRQKWFVNFILDATVTFTHYKNKILQLTSLDYFSTPYEMAGPFIRNQKGHAASKFYGFKIIGLFQDDADVQKSATQNAAAPGRFKYLDATGNGVIDDSDRVFIGDPNPKFTTGLNISLTYKNFDLSTFIYGSFGNDVNNVTRFVLDFFPAVSKAALYDSWTPQRTSAHVPIAEVDDNFSTRGSPNSYAVESGTYVRNKSMILGYTLPVNWLKKISIQKIRFYFQVVNLFTISNYSGLDPELSGHSTAFGQDFGNYPNNEKQFLLGLSVIF